MLMWGVLLISVLVVGEWFGINYSMLGLSQWFCLLQQLEPDLPCNTQTTQDLRLAALE